MVYYSNNSASPGGFGRPLAQIKAMLAKFKHEERVLPCRCATVAFTGGAGYYQRGSGEPGGGMNLILSR